MKYKIQELTQKNLQKIWEGNFPRCNFTTEQIKYNNVIPNNCDLFWMPHYNIPLFLSSQKILVIYAQNAFSPHTFLTHRKNIPYNGNNQPLCAQRVNCKNLPFYGTKQSERWSAVNCYNNVR